MAELVLRLRLDPATGKRVIVIDYASDSDALPIEHEDEHRRLANKVVDGGLASEAVSVTRDAETPPTPGAESGAHREPVATPTATKR